MKITTACIVSLSLLNSTTGFVLPLQIISKEKRPITTPIFAEGRTLKFESSAARQAGAGTATVDLNVYNLPLNQIYQEWTANLVAKTANTEVGIKLGCKNSREILVDSMQVAFSRRQGAGLGIVLEELAGGREDGLGITIVSGLVENGPAIGADIIPGDSITKVSVIRRMRSQAGTALSDEEKQFTAVTECLCYDATVDAISRLPPQEKDDELFVISLKRLRRKPKVRVHLQYPPEQNEPDATLEIFSGENLRSAMLVRGVKLNDPLAKRFDNKNSGNCGAHGLCTTCAVSIVKGSELLNPKRVSEQQMLANSPRWRLSCKAIVGWGMQEGEMTIRVNPRQW